MELNHNYDYDAQILSSNFKYSNFKFQKRNHSIQIFIVL